jgi:putative lipoic acid-binding regulatory protein
MRRLPDDMRAMMDYPCSWSYRVIGPDAAAMRLAVSSVVGERVVSVEISNSSRTGRYVALEVVTRVESEDDRLALYDALRAHDSIVLVI